MRYRVLYHDHCFDGAASAAFFSRFIADHIHPGAEFAYTGMSHVAAQSFEDALFDGDENAIVDFKYATHEKLTWWFDHHQSAFLSPSDAEHFRALKANGDPRGARLFFDPAYRSCTQYIADVTHREFGYAPADLANLVHWADIVDSARYASAEEAVALGSPALKIVLIIEAAKGHDTVQRLIRMMQRMSLEEIVADPGMQELYLPLRDRHQRNMDLIRRHAVCEQGVVTFDLVGEDVEGYNKFIPYYLFPEAVYTVSVSEQSFRTKVSVGSNPWVKQPLAHNLASICERYGGGGHPKVGAISFPTGAFEAARTAAREIQAELRG
ncbi:MAG: phosphoesterase [Bryobacteraceae bacterium]|nr:phosphoesterase [Bryobacteraceae bacterium]